MGWDRKRWGLHTGCYYRSVRIPGKTHPVKVYYGRGVAGHEAATEVERRRHRITRRVRPATAPIPRRASLPPTARPDVQSYTGSTSA